MNEDIATIEAATPLARGNELILEHMNRLARATAKALGQGDYHEVSLSAQAMQCLHSELRKSVFVPQYAGTPSIPWYAGDVIALTDENCHRLCTRMAEMARTANRTNESSFSMYQLQGIEIALECLGVPYAVNFNPKLCKRTKVRVGTVTMDVEPESGSE